MREVRNSVLLLHNLTSGKFGDLNPFHWFADVDTILSSAVA